MNSETNHSYLLEVGKDHQKKFAQFFTPPPAAKFMVQWLLHENTCREIFDPAFGLGAFFDETPNNVQFSGMDADARILHYFMARNTAKKITVSCENYLLNFGNRHQAIVCNPPYLKFQKIENRKIIFQKFKDILGISLSGYTNMASAFLAKSLTELSDDGRLAYIMPYEFLNAGYGVMIKKMLLDHHTEAILRINCEKDVFPNATTSICIILYDKSKNFENLNFYSIDRLQDLDKTLSVLPKKSVNTDNLNPENKWGKYFDSPKRISLSSEVQWVPLSTYGHFSRGIATGANEFFILSPQDVQHLHLAVNDYALCITKSSQITSPVFQSANIQELISCNSKIYLFSPSSQISSQAEEYIRFGELNKYHERYLLCHRKPWYKTEIREIAPILLNVFSRGKYKVIKNETNAVSLTCYHNFYPNLLSNQLTDVLFLFLYSSVGHTILAYSQRQYGNNLNKFEPNDLNHSLIPSAEYFEKINLNTAKQLVNDLRKGKDVLPQIDALFSDLCPQRH